LKLIATLVLMMVASLAACGGSQDDSTTPPAKSEGVVSARSTAFQKYSGKGAGHLHIAEFGIEASDKDRREVQSAIDTYLKALGNGEWDRACGMVSEVLKQEIAEIAAQAQGAPRPSCGEILKALSKASRGQGEQSPISAPRGISSLRIREGPGAGFALFHGSNGEDYWITVKRETGTWNVTAAAPRLFR
jgi:hypothetical protein